MAIGHYVVVGQDLNRSEARRIVRDFMNDESRRGEQEPMVLIQSKGKERQLWLRVEWDKQGDDRPFNWEEV